MEQALERGPVDANGSEAWKGVIAGAAGGLAGCVAMNAFQRMWSKAATGSAPDSAAGPHDGREWQEHFAFGAAMGALYGYFVETGLKGDVENGARFGMSVWAAADEAAMPALGLSESTLEQPGELHMQSFASHIVFGVTTEAVRRTVRAMLR